MKAIRKKKQVKILELKIAKPEGIHCTCALAEERISKFEDRVRLANPKNMVGGGGAENEEQ